MPVCLLRSFPSVQVGDDPAGTAYLREVSAGLAADCKFPIVDSVPVDCLQPDLTAFLKTSSMMRSFETAPVPTPAPFRQAGKHNAINEAIRRASGGNLAAERAKSPGGTSPRPPASVDDAIRRASGQGPLHKPTADRSRSPNPSHDAINAAIRRSSGGNLTVDRPKSPGNTSPRPPASVDEAIRRASASGVPGDAKPLMRKGSGSTPPPNHGAINVAIRRASGGNLTTDRPRSPDPSHGAVNAAIRRSSSGGASDLHPLHMAFLNGIAEREKQDYVMLLDCSRYMSQYRWNSARQAIAKLGPMCCDLDEDGIALYLFNKSWKKAGCITSGAVIDDIFMKHYPEVHFLLPSLPLSSQSLSSLPPNPRLFLPIPCLPPPCPPSTCCFPPVHTTKRVDEKRLTGATQCLLGPTGSPGVSQGLRCQPHGVAPAGLPPYGTT